MKYLLFENEASLPRLPVPTLQATLNLILEGIKPLVSAEEYIDFANEATEILSNDTVALIQNHLLAAAANDSVPCYLNAVNGESYPGIYGDLRGDTLPRNPFLVLEEDPYAKTINPPNQAQRCASLINSSLKFVVSLRNGTLKPDITPGSSTPLTMNCYMNLFGTTRVPGSLQHNQSVSIKKYNSWNESRHVVFVSNNQYFSLEVLTPCEDVSQQPKHKIWFKDAELAPIIEHIIETSAQVDNVTAVKNGIGAITTQTYNHWKSARLELLNTNEQAIETIDNALFVVVLDTTCSPVTDQEKVQVISHGTNMLHKGTNIQVGSCTSRWYDKLQLIVTGNATAGVVWESSSMDSTAILRFISDIYTDLILKLAKNINGAENTLFDESVQFVSGKESDLKPMFQQIEFNLSGELKHLIHLSETRLADLLNQHEYKNITIKLDSHALSKIGVLPDSFLQIGFQIANYALYGRIANTMEPITTRKFKDARTDLVVVQNEEIATLAKLFITSADNNKKWELFKACCQEHTAKYRGVMKGCGCERHFSALLQVLSDPQAASRLNALNAGVSGLAPLPSREEMSKEHVPFFSNELIERLVQPEFLISNCGNPALRLFGIAPAVDQGFGIGYIIHKDKVVITASSKFRQTERLINTFHSVVRELQSMARTESTLALNIADSGARKNELMRLRVRKELKNINKELTLTRHPIDIESGFKSGEFKLRARSPLEEGRSRNSSSASSGSSSDENREDEYHYLGGYGYFDEGEVDSRNYQLSRNESHLSSHPHSHMTSRTGSTHHSLTDLPGMLNQQVTQGGTLGQADLKQRISMNDRIRDKLSPANGALTSSLDEIIRHREWPYQEHFRRKKNEIGREVALPRL